MTPINWQFLQRLDPQPLTTIFSTKEEMKTFSRVLSASLIALLWMSTRLISEPVTITNAVNGQGLILGTGTFESGTTVTLRAVPQVDWKFDHWEGVEVENSTNTIITFISRTLLQPKAVFVEMAGNGRFQGGEIVAWGSNIAGQTTIPVGLTNVTAVAAGENFTIALRNDGTVAAWGSNMDGQRLVPSSLDSVTAIAAAYTHTIALKKDGTLVAWGNSNDGRTIIPPGLTGVSTIAAGRLHSVALKNDGSVVAWGGNSDGQINVPPNLHSITAVAAGSQHTVALKKDGTVIAWGGNAFGQTAVPANLKNVTAIAAGAQHSIALKDDGTVVAWGADFYGQATIPSGLNGVKAIAAGWHHTIALKEDGSIVAWGKSEWGEPIIPPDLTGTVSLAAGNAHSASLQAKGLGIIQDSPRHMTAERGKPILLKVNTANADRYQWYRNRELLVGSNGFKIYLNNPTEANSGTYQVLLENEKDAIFSAPIVLRILPNGFPKVLADGIEVAESTRRGDSTEIRLTTTLSNGQIFFTLDGTEPSLDSRLYTGPFRVTNSVVVHTYAISGDFAQEALGEPVSIQIVPTYVLTTTVSGNGRIERTPSLARYLEDDVVTVSAIPEAGWRFVRWEGDLGGSFPTRNVALGRSKSIRAIFETIPRYPIVVRYSNYRIPGNEQVPLPGQVVRRIQEDWEEGQPVILEYIANGLPSPRDNVFLSFYETNGICTFRDTYNGNLLYPYADIGDVMEAGSEGLFFRRGVSVPWSCTSSEFIGRYRLGAVTNHVPWAFSPIYINWGEGVIGGANFIPPHPGSIQVMPRDLRPMEGQRLEISTVPKPNWTFLGWSGDHVGSESNFSWIVDGPATFEANFGTTVSTLATGSGRVLLDPDLPLYPYGTQVKVIPVPNAGNYLALWGEAGTGQPKTEWVLTVTNAVPRVTALFRSLAADKVTLTAQSTLGGRIQQPSAEGIYSRGAVVTVTAVAEAGFEFTGWSGDASGAETMATLTLDSAKTVRAAFRRAGVVTHPVTVTVTGPGSVRRVPDLGAYEVGSDVDLVADPATNAVFGGWSGAGAGAQRRIRLTIGGPTAVTARFLEMHPVATEVRGEGQVLLSPPDGRYASGTEIAVTARASEGWGFVQWSGDISGTGQEASVVMDGPRRLVAEFARLGTLTTRVQGQGTVARSPEAASYLPGTAVSLRANPSPGWRFARWSGGASGTNSSLDITIGRTAAIVAEFADVEAPSVAVEEPSAATATDGRTVLRGRVSDNVGVLGVAWTWNGIPQPDLVVQDGRFASGPMDLRVGLNRIELVARDAAGNEAHVVREVTWNPIRTLAAGTASEVQEGQRLVFPLSLTAPGDVAGLRFRLTYDPIYLADPQVEWGSLVGQGVNTLNLGLSGEIEGAFALAGSTLPGGSNRVAVVSFRARSTAATTQVVLQPVLVNAANSGGDALTNGNGAIPGEGRIKPRRIIGDNNANQRLDIGDAVVISRLQVGLEYLRSWDVGLNDLNASADVDSGDVIRVLRAVVGLDPQPRPTALMELLGVDLRKSLPPSVNTNEVVVLEYPDGPEARVGQPWRLVVRLLRSRQAPSGLSFTLRYPAGLTLAGRQVGSLVPAGALPLWGELGGGLTFAAVSPDAWPTGSGVAAVLTFEANAALATQAEWPVTLSPVELTVNGFDIRALDDVVGTVRSVVVPEEPPVVSLPPPNPDGTLTLEVRAGAGQTVVVETTTDLGQWTEERRVTGQGTGTPVRVSITPQTGVQARFWRLRRP